MKRAHALKPVPPFDFAKTLAFLQDFQASGTSYLIDNGALAFALEVAGALVTVELEALGSVAAPTLRCTLYAASPLAPDVETAVLARVRFHLGLDDDLAPFYALAEKDDAFRPVLERLYGYHLVKFATPFEAACWALVTQRTPNRFAFKVMRRLASLLGNRVTHRGQTLLTFPPPERLLIGAEERVLEATNNTRKTERLLAVARAFSAVDEAFLRTAPFEEVRRWLKGVRGLGDWSADYVLLRGLGRTERTPWSDMWLLNAISHVYTHGFSISRGDARRLAESYGWYQGYWVHYLRLAP